MSVGLVVKPLIHGFPARSRIDFLSAPSANILTFNVETRSGMTQDSRLSFLNDPGSRFTQGANAQVGRIRTALAVTVIHEKGLATRALSCFHVAPAVAHDVAFTKIDTPSAGRVEQETGPGLAAGTMRGVVMRAHADVVQLQIPLQQSIDFGYLFDQHGSTRDVRLVGDQDQSESGFAQLPASFAPSRQQAEIGERSRRIRAPFAQEGAIHHSTAIEKHPPPHTFTASPPVRLPP